MRSKSLTGENTSVESLWSYMMRNNKKKLSAIAGVMFIASVTCFAVGVCLQVFLLGCLASVGISWVAFQVILGILGSK
jgi:hypothetical protein